MARELSTPLTGEDLVFLRQRHPEAYVQRQIELYGAEDGAEEAETSPETGDEGSEDTEPTTTPAEPGEGDSEDEDGDEEEEDLIGGDTEEVFDVIGATESEVKAWAESASPEAKAAALATEQAREDRDPRKGVVGLLS